MKNKVLNIIGLMSGTSLDGIDISLVETNGSNYFKNINNSYYEYPKKIKQELKQFSENFENMIANKSLLKYFNNLINKEHEKALKRSNFINKCDLIGFHGQTIYHDASNKISLQLGDGQQLANNIQKKIIFNLRTNDINNGGQGAPLAPIYHKYMIENLKIGLPCCFLNIGGVANITYWDGETLIGFDTGPGNGLMDKYMQDNFNKKYDKGGIVASKGFKNNEILHIILENPFFKLYPPKSLDKNQFNFIFNLMNSKNLNSYDIMATLSELTFLSILRSFKFFPKKIKNLVVMGGGVHNNNLLKKFKNIDGIKTNTAREKKISSDFVESELIAYITARSFFQIPFTFPSTTGVKNSISGGTLYRPKTNILN